MRVSRPDSGASSAQCAHSGTQGPEQGAPGGQDPAAPSASLGTCSEEGTLPATGPEAPPLLKSASGACQGAPPEAGGVRTAGGRACLPPPLESPRPSALAQARRAGGTAKRSGRSEKRVGSLLRFQHGKRQLFQQRPGQGGPGRQAAVKHLVYRTWGEESRPSPSRETSTRHRRGRPAPPPPQSRPRGSGLPRTCAGARQRTGRGGGSLPRGREGVRSERRELFPA